MKKILGLDIGIGSCGWALINQGDLPEDFEIIALGARCFPVPENAKNKSLNNKERRDHRSQRRVIRRRGQRMRDVRDLLKENGLSLPPVLDNRKTVGDLGGAITNPWQIRAEALDRLLVGTEFARALIHLTKHRGFKSNKKGELSADNAKDKETGAVLSAVAKMKEKLQEGGYRTIGEMLFKDEEFQGRKRNRSGDYSHTTRRSDLEDETRAIFEAQKSKGNRLATDSLLEQFLEQAFSQRPLQSSVPLIGSCVFEPSQRRAHRNSPSFELFRFYSKLNNVKVLYKGKDGREENFLSREQREIAHRKLAARLKDVKFNTLRSKLKLKDDFNFNEPARQHESKASLGRFEGCGLFKKALGDERFFSLLENQIEQLDEAANIIFYNDDRERIIDLLRRRTQLSQEDVEKLTEPGTLSQFTLKGTGNLSNLACRNILVHLKNLDEHLVYDKACARAGYDHKKQADTDKKDVRNPVVRRILSESEKQVRAIVQRYGRFDAVHIEMARDVGKTVEDRNAIDKANKKRFTDRERTKEDLRDLFGRDPNGTEILRYELWKAQGGICPFTGDYINNRDLEDGNNSVQIDHILPLSQSQDNSFHNKVLVTAKANQDKGQRTPFAWFGDDLEKWDEYSVRIAGMNLHRQKARKLLSKTFSGQARKDYVERNLNDTRYAAKVFRKTLEQMYPYLETKEGGERKIFVRPGPITAMVRRAWGLNKLKHGEGEDALGDRDHALDALVVACTNEGLLKYATEEAKASGDVRYHKESIIAPTPLGDGEVNKEKFRRLVEEKCRSVFVSRSERRYRQGAAHEATLYARRLDENGNWRKVIRKPLEKLKLDDLDRLAGDPERCGTLREILRIWLEDRAKLSGKELKTFVKENLPKMTRRGERSGFGTGPAIRSVRVLSGKKLMSWLELERGVDAGGKPSTAYADNGRMVRLDVFTKKGRYYLVPVYVHQYATWKSPPNQVIKPGKPESEWDAIDDTYEFQFSLSSDAYTEMEERSGRLLEGYYIGCDRANGIINYSPHYQRGTNTRPQSKRSKTLKSIRKYRIDRFGRKHLIEKEERKWPGGAS